jgi:plasmid stabilization system protein ParE
MSLPVILRPPTEADVEDICDDLDRRRAGLARQFLDRLREVLERIESMPEMYGVVLQDVRAVRLRKLQFVVYYVVFTDRAEVLAVIHGSRDESAWKSRI